ncbi:NACHT, LRR and PYD domains-containing protein 12-like isoform X1 [Engystomops pustulosus]
MERDFTTSSGPKMSPLRPSDDDWTRQFYQKLCLYEHHILRATYEYFLEDLQYIVENWRSLSLLHELSSRNIPDLKKYQGLEKGSSTIAHDLLNDIFLRGREAVITLWVSLHVLQKDHGSPTLEALLEELHHRGDSLVEQILLDEEGHHLHPELKDIQTCHKKNLYEKSKELREFKPPRCNQEEEHFPFCTRYVNLIIVSTHHFRERSENELIETGVKHEEYLREIQNELQCISLNKMFRWCHRSKLVPHMVMVVGVPGVGKTTLMQKFVYDWVKGDLYQRFSFVFFFKFRELNRLDKVSLETLILHHYPYLWQQLGNIFQDPEKLLFIFDGLDESNQTMDFTSRHLCSDPKQPERCGDIVVSLVRKSLLNGCSVLMTSRPTRLASMDCEAFQRMVEISGFSPKERRIYFDNFFRDPELAEKAFTYVRQNDTLYTFCYLPSYCWIICTVLSRSFQTTSSDQQVSLLPRTVTQLFAIFVANILSNHSPEKSGAQKLLQSMGWMAEHGVMNHTIIFDGRDLESFEVDNRSRLLSSFLMESEEPVSYSFLHLTVQEFFSALVHYVDFSLEKLEQSLNKAKFYPDGRGEMFLRFLCGLSDDTTRSILSEYLDTQAAQASREVITWVKDLNVEEEKLMFSNENKQLLLNIFYYLFESRNKVLVQEYFKSLRSLDLSRIHLSALDCTLLAFILENCRYVEELALEHSSLDNEGLERLAPGLLKLKFLSLTRNKIPDTSCMQLASVIRNNRSLKKLILSCNHLSGPHLSDLMEALSSSASQIELLDFYEDDLPDNIYLHFPSIVRNKPSLKTLILASNRLSGPHFGDLMEALSCPSCRVEELRLTFSNLNGTACIQLASLIRKHQYLKKLDLFDSLSGPHIEELMEALSSPHCRIEILDLGRNNLPNLSCIPLASGIRNNHNLKRLDLSDNHLSGPHLRDLLDALSNPGCRIEELHLERNGWTKKEKDALRELESRKPDLRIYF